MKLSVIVANIFSKKIKAKNLYSYRNNKLNIKGIKLLVPTDMLPAEFSVGELSNEIAPSDVSDELKRLDILQLQLANTINSMNEGIEKDKSKKEYFDTLLKMINLVHNPKSISEDVKKKDKISGTNLYEFYKNSGYEISNITSNDLENPGVIIWPVALQDRPTIIHKAQIEIIKALQLTNWSLKILIADCGTINVEDKIIKFRRELEKHLNKRDVKYEKISLLSDYYNPDADGGKILKKFTEISSKLKISELNEYNTKNNSYSAESKQIVENRFTLKFIQPVLTWSVVIHEAEKYFEQSNGKKTIIIAGKDELKQWKYIFGFSATIGGVFNDILEDETNNTIFQEAKPMIFHSENEIIQSLDKGNLAKWLFESFISTPNFPSSLANLSFCTACKKVPDCRLCIFKNYDVDKLPEFIDKEKFVASFWNILNPA
jgi:hypothetical protein